MAYTLTCPLNLLTDWNLDNRVSIRLRGTGFDTLRGFDIGLRHNIAILNALLKYYHTDKKGFVFRGDKFHVGFGLEDVLYLTGLPIDGEPVTGVDPANTEAICQQLLGISEGYGVKGRIKLSWLRKNFMDVQVSESDEKFDCYVRAYVMYVIGCTFAPSAASTVSSAFLPLLANIADIRNYAWGAAYLACLYHDMDSGNKNLCGFYFPLLVFAYMRFPGLLCGAQLDRTHSDRFPLAVNWSQPLHHLLRDSFTGHNEQFLDTFFANLAEKDIVWRPYAELHAYFLPLHLREQLPLRTSLTILLCFEKAVYHRPDWCKRQLGLEGPDPDPKDEPAFMTIKAKQRTGAKSGKDVDWRTKPPYDTLIPVWNVRRTLMIDPHAPVIKERKRKNIKFFLPEEQPVYTYEQPEFEELPQVEKPRRRSARNINTKTS